MAQSLTLLKSLDSRSEKDSSTIIENGVKISTAIVAVAGLLIGIYQFNQGQKNNIELEYSKIHTNDSINFANKLWEQKMNVYMAMGGMIGRIVSIQKEQALPDSLLRSFEMLYYGQAILIEDHNVDSTLVLFRNTLYDYKNGMSSLDVLKLIGISTTQEIGKALRNKQN